MLMHCLAPNVLVGIPHLSGPLFNMQGKVTISPDTSPPWAGPGRISRGLGLATTVATTSWVCVPALYSEHVVISSHADVNMYAEHATPDSHIYIHKPFEGPGVLNDLANCMAWISRFQLKSHW